MREGTRKHEERKKRKQKGGQEKRKEGDRKRREIGKKQEKKVKKNTKGKRHEGTKGSMCGLGLIITANFPPQVWLRALGRDRDRPEHRRNSV